jgi:hypothetical protein
MVRVTVEFSGAAELALESLKRNTGRSAQSLLNTSIRTLDHHHCVRLNDGKIEIVDEDGARREFIVAF